MMRTATTKESGPQKTYQIKSILVSYFPIMNFDIKNKVRLTAVTVSIHNTNGSEVRYLESESEYSFHICPNRSCMAGMLA